MVFKVKMRSKRAKENVKKVLGEGRGKGSGEAHFQF